MGSQVIICFENLLCDGTELGLLLQVTDALFVPNISSNFDGAVCSSTSLSINCPIVQHD